MERIKPEIERRAHYWVFTAQSLKNIIHDFCEDYRMDWTLVAEENPDKKVWNG